MIVNTESWYNSFTYDRDRDLFILTEFALTVIIILDLDWIIYSKILV